MLALMGTFFPSVIAQLSETNEAATAPWDFDQDSEFGENHTPFCYSFNRIYFRSTKLGQVLQVLQRKISISNCILQRFGLHPMIEGR